MSPETSTNWRRTIPFLWLALSAGWAIVILVTDSLAWPLALWVATTLGPLSALQRLPKTPTEPKAPR